MFHKASTHFRPLLRLPSHAPVPTPDHFTPNPSLLHHLPSNASSGSAGHLVSQAPNAAASGSGAGRAGPNAGAGYGSGGASGGYTGHARAFLSLPQTSPDGASSLISDDSRKNKSGLQDSPRSKLLLAQHQHRYGHGNRTRIVQISEEDGLDWDRRRMVRRELEARVGSGRVALVELEEEGARGRVLGLDASDGGREVESRQAAGELGWISDIDEVHVTQEELDTASPSRTSARSRLLSPTPSHHSSVLAGRAQSGLPRSHTSLDLWQVGVIPSRPPLGIRAMSSAASGTTPVPIIDLAELEEIDVEIVPRAPRATSRVLSQPNRVLMDLAGLDIPSRNTRSYATAAAATESVTDEHVDYPVIDSDENDRRIYSALHHAVKDGEKGLFHGLVAHYRTARSAEMPATGNPELASHLPLPSGYTVGTYNICLSGLLDLRGVGETVAPILEIYNEMLERDIIPNNRTYTLIIQALCVREKDVSAAVNQRKEQRKWDIWKQNTLRIRHRGDLAQQKDLIIKGYQAENNFESAMKLFRGVLAFHSNSHAAESDRSTYRFYPIVYNYLLDACSAQAKPDLAAAVEVFRQAQAANASGTSALYRHLFKAYAAAGDLPGLQAMWEEFEQGTEAGLGTKLREWRDILPGKEIEDREIQVEQAQVRVHDAAIRAFISLGQHEQAIQIFERMLPRLGTNRSATVLSQAPRATTEAFGSLIVALAESDQFDLAKEWYGKYLASPLGGTLLRANDVSKYLDALTYKGRWKEAIDLYIPILEKAQLENSDYKPDVLRLKRIYGCIIAEARQAEIANDVEEIFSAVSPLLSFRDILVDPEYVIPHVRVLLRHRLFAAIPAVLDQFGPLRLSHVPDEISKPLHNLLVDVVESEAGFVDVIASLKAFARHRTRPSVGRQDIGDAVIRKYLAARSDTEKGSNQLPLDAEGWYTLIGCFARLNGEKLNEGEYDQAFEFLVEDLTAAVTGGADVFGTEDRTGVTRALAERLFDRFGRERAEAMLKPLIGDQAQEILSTFVDSSGSSASSSASTPSSPLTDATGPSTPESMSSIPPPQTQPSDSSSRKSRLRLDPQLSRRIDEHFRGQSSVTPLSAYEELKSALSRSVVPYPEAVGRLIVGLAKAGDEPRALELYSFAQSILPIMKAEQQAHNWSLIENAMISAHCLLGNLEQAGLHRARLVEAGMTPTADAFATMIAHTKDTTDDALVARELWAESQAMGIKPHLYLYNTIISKLSKARKAEMALELFQQMKREGVAPSSVTYGAIINACCRVGDAESAEILFEEMSSQPNFRARVPPFNTMMQFYLQTRPNRERVLYYHDAMQKARVRPSAHTYKLLLDAHASLAPIELTAMERVFNDLCHDRNVSVQGTHWASLITAYGISAGDIDKALEVFDNIPTHPAARGVNAHSEPVVWEAILNVLASKGTIEQMESMHQRMLATPGARTTAYVSNVLISGYARGGDIQKAREVFEAMGDSITGVAAPNNHPQLLTSSGHVKPSTITSGPTDVVYREPSTYESMIKAELGAGHVAEAEAILRRMEERRYPVAVFMRARGLLDHALGQGQGQGQVPGQGLGQGQGEAEALALAEGLGRAPVYSQLPESPIAEAQAETRGQQLGGSQAERSRAVETQEEGEGGQTHKYQHQDTPA